MTERRIEYMPLEQLVAANRNPKRHSPDIAKSLQRFGYGEPIFYDERTNKLVAGHGRLEALLELKKAGVDAPGGVNVIDGVWHAPIVRGWASRNDQEAEAYLLASNRLTEAGGWDESMLADMVSGLAADGALDGLGFDMDFLTKLLDGVAPKKGKTEPDDVPDVPEGPLRVALGDVWVLGNHRITCGDSTDAAVVDRVMGGDKAAICWTDPPWNVAYGDTHETKKHKSIANDDLGDKFPAFCDAFCAAIVRATLPGGMIYMAMSAQEWPTIHGALTAAGLHWSSSVIWVKDSLVLSRKDYHTRYEPIWYGWNDNAPRLCPLEDRTQSDVWEIPRPKKSDVHPTMKPVELIVRSLKNSSAVDDIVFEPFSGSGSTLIACEQTGRKCRAIELDPRYVQVGIERWEAFVGKVATKE